MGARRHRPYHLGMTRRAWWQLGVVLVTASLRLAAAAWANPVVMPDSDRYRNDADPLAPFHAWDGQGPGLLTQLMHLLPLSAAILVQTALAAALWGAAAIYAASLAPRRFSWPTFLTLHAWSLSPWFFIWDTWVLAEALTVGACALTAVGVGAAHAHRPSAKWVAVLGLAVAVLVRPFAGAMLLPLVVLALLWPPSKARLRATAAAMTATTALAVFATWQVVAFATAPNPQFSYLPEPETLTQIQATDRLAGRGHLPGYLELARREGMPSCPQAEAIVAGSSENKLKDLREITDCPELDRWLASGGLHWTREFTDNTESTVRELFRPSYWLRDSFRSYITPDDRLLHVRRLALTRWDETVLAVNSVMLLAGAAACASVLLLPGRRTFMAFSLSVVVLVSLYIWGTDGIEYWRHLLPAFAVILPLAVTLLACRGPTDRGRELDQE